jgi:hypothetical protein
MIGLVPLFLFIKTLHFMKNYYFNWYRLRVLYGLFLAAFFFCCSFSLSAETLPYSVTNSVTNNSTNNPIFRWSTSATTRHLPGFTPRIYSVDIHDNSGIATETYIDTVSPVAICKNVVIQLGQGGTIIITPNYLNNGSYDNSGIVTVTISKNTFTCADLGLNYVTVTATDGAGNVSTCIATVFVQDLLPPVAFCKSATIYLDANGNATLTANQVNNNSYDNCGIETMSISKTNFTCADLGANTVTLTVTDSSGNSASCTSTVTVVNNTPPTAICQNVDVYLDANGNATIGAIAVNNGSFGSCGSAVSVSLNKTNFNCADIGTNQVILTVTDQWGNSSNCTANVNVFDTIAPQVTCPADITVNLTSGCTQYIVLPLPTIFEACGGTAMVVMTDNPNVVITLTNSGSFAGVFPLGTTNVVYKVDDGLGNWEMCNFNVTVNDLLPPTIVNLPVSFTVSTDPGVCQATVNWQLPTATDNCPNVTLISSHDSGDIFPIGTTTVVYTATDAAGNSTVDSFKVTVQDTEAPIVHCKLTAVLAGGVINVNDVYAGSSDNCGVDLSTLQLVIAGPLNCNNLGQVAYTLTVQDIYGNIGSCSGTINVIDNIPPVANCQDVTAYLDANGNATITAAMVNNGSTDNCGIASMTLNKTLFNCSDIGTQSVTLTVTDFSGNSSTCNALVYVKDTVAPDLLTQNATVYLDVNGKATVKNNDVIASKSDNCGIKTIQVVRRTFNCNHIGANTVNVTVTDYSGNSVTKTAIVTVLDTLAPVLQCKNTVLYLDANGKAKLEPNDVIQSATDNCGVTKKTIDRRNFNCSHIGTNDVIVTIQDKSGNTASCTAVVTVVDTIAPKAVCKNITVMLDLNGQAFITAADIDGGSTDNCGIKTLTASQTTFNCSHVGQNTVSLIVTDKNGNTSTCTAIVTVVDMVFPTAKCKNATVYLNGNGQVVINPNDINNGSFDNCGIANMTVSPNTFNCSNIGLNNVTFTVTDINGNSSICNATVTVVDNTPPVAICKNAIVYLNANGQATITTAKINNGSTDNCGITTMTVSQSTFNCSNIGVNQVTLTVTDAAGNSSTCTANVTVVDNTPPVAICKNATVYLNANGQATITTANINNGSTDNCGITTMTVSKSTFNCSNIGVNQVTLTVTDAAGNSSTCTANVTVVDNTPPVAICKNATVYLNANGQATITTANINNGSTDNCGITTMTVSQSTFNCSNIGDNTVTLTVTDASGNSSTCTATVTVKDDIAPTVSCNNIMLFLNQNGQVTVNQNNLIWSMSDNCGITNVTLGQTLFTCADLGTNAVNVTVSDAAGNTATCTALVTIKEDIPPTVITKNITVYLDANGQVSINAGDVNNGSSDNCGILSMTVSPNTFNCSNIGANQVTLTVMDNFGNAASATATVTVLDNIPPVALCKNATVTLNANGQATITAADINNGSTDNCNIASMTVSPNTFNCSNIGDNTVTLTVTDGSGNVSTCTATVIVLSGGQPTVHCKNATVYLNGNGQVTLTSADVVQSATGGCGSATTISISPNTFNCSQIGTHTVTVTATDANGATATCTATVTVLDNTAPVALCKNATVTLNANGQATISTADINNGSTDNCGIASMTVSPNTFNCSNIGANTVTLTVTDGSGNTSTCTATVTVLGGGQPVVHCKNATVYLNGNGQVTLTSADVVQSVTGGCGSTTTISISPSTFNCSQIGTHTVTVTATDVNGATATCTATVTVLDNTAPIALCKNATVTLNANGQATISTADINNGSTDNCGIASMTVSPNTFNCSNIGANTVTLTVTDASGNTSTCTATVTVQSSVTATITSTPATCNELTICKDGTPNSAGYTVALHGTPGSSDYKSTTWNPLTLIQYSDGSARIRGEIYNVADATKRWEVDIYLHQKMDLATYQATYSGTPWSQSGDPVSTWDYYIMDASKPNKMFGRGSFAGSTMDITHQPTNLTKAFQVGNGASLYRSNNSLSGWFFMSNSYSGTGDFDFDLQGCQVVQGETETCQDGTPTSANYALVLHGNTNGTTKYKSNPSNPLVLKRKANGSATITGEIQDITNTNKKWAVNVNLYQKMDLTTYQNNYSGTAWSQSGDPVSTWDYYIMDATATNTFTGLGALTGQSINLTHQPTNLTKAFQVGNGASLYRTNNSVSGWFYFAGSDAGTGDFDFDLTNCVIDTACNGTATVAVTGGCNTTTTATTTVDWDIATCSAGSTYTEFTPTVSANACVNVTASILSRASGGHSCNYGRPNGDGVGVCADGFTNSTFVSASSKAYTFQVTIPANSNGTLSKMSFWELSTNQIQFLTTGNTYYSNNHPTKYGVRVLKNNVEIFKQIDIPTTSTWSLEDFNFSGTTFNYSGGEVFKFELYAYAPAGLSSASYQGIWDIDEVSVQLNCNTVTPPTFTYQWSNGATTSSITGLCPGDYTVSVTDANNNNVYTGTVNVADSSNNCTPAPPVCNVTCPQGSLTTFQYNVGNGTQVSTVFSHATFPNNPYNVHYITNLTQNGIAEYHGIWTRGYIIPTVTGLYDIYLSSDDNGKLWLSPNCDSSSKVLVGEVTGWTNYKEWTKYTSQKTTNVYLQAGKPYYFEMVMKNQNGGGHWSIGWVKPGSSTIEVIEGKHVANYKCNNCTNTTNLALNKPSVQSSTCYNGSASRANDGNTNGNFNNGSVSHTCYNTNPFWELDLQNVYEIDEIKIWNRTDAYANRLINYYVFVSNVPFTSSNITTLKNDPNNWWNYQTVQAGSPTVIAVNRTGRYVCVMINGSQYLHLAEVEVMGCGINNVILSQANPNANNTIVNPMLPNNDAETPQDFEVNAYPNPFNDRLTLEAFVPTDEEFLNVRIIDMTGKVIYTNNQISTTGEIIEDLDIPNLPNGMYILEAKTANQLKTVKLVKVGKP